MRSKKPFVACNTLLDPDNVVPSWENGSVETREISMRMREQRQEYDRVHRNVVAREKELEMMKKKLERLQSDESHIEDTNTLNQYRIDSGSEHLSNIKETHDFEKMNHWIYKHMIGRMKADLIATQISANEYHEAFK